MPSPFAGYTNSTLQFSIPSGELLTDPATGNRYPGAISTTISAFLKSDKSRDQNNLYYPGLDESEERLSGYATNPTLLPVGVGHLSRAWATITDPVTKRTKSGYFTLYRGTPSPFGVEAVTGAVLKGIFKSLVEGTIQAAPVEPPGDGQYVAGSDLAAFRVVALVGGVLVYADRTNLAHMDAIAGITLNAVSAGGYPLLKRDGLVDNVGWDWVPGEPIFLDTAGQLTQNAEGFTSGFLLLLGWVPTPNQLHLEIEEPIILG